jgi:hypothetical protein
MNIYYDVLTPNGVYLFGGDILDPRRRGFRGHGLDGQHHPAEDGRSKDLP